jgi:tetratricopeptide (TPR) repeat protein
MPTSPLAADGRGRARDALLALFLASAVVLAYAGTRTHGFVNFDDPEYVVENPRVAAGLTLAGARWAFTAVHSANWHPLTWLSHMLDCHLFGLDPGWHHVTNVALHALATVCLFAALRAMTDSPWRSAFVAALFALHPRNVESVAWISERKDVLSAVFWNATLWAYAGYARRATRGRYLAVAALLVCGLLAKPMVVTLPAVLLLLDVWPLGRVRPANGQGGARALVRAARPLVVEKLPLFALALVSAIVTFEAQRRSGAVATLEALPADVRLQNAAVAYVKYLWSLLWPADLAAFYPYRMPLPPAEVAASLLVLAAISALVVRLGVTRPYLLVGWLWYLGTLLPVIGIVRAGEQAMADRFTYLPAIGVFVAAVWGLADAVAHRPGARRALAAAACALLVAHAAATHAQAMRWRDSVTLFEHALRVTERNYLAHTNLAAALLERGDVSAAVEHAAAAAAVRPDDPKVLVTQGAALARAGQWEAAHAAYGRALDADPASALALLGRGVLLAQQERWPESESAYAEILRREPRHAKAHAGLGYVLAAQGRNDDAIAHYRAAIAADGGLIAARNGLALALEASGAPGDALAVWREAVQLAPEDTRLRFNLASALASRGQLAEAESEYRALLQLAPRRADARLALADVLAASGREAEARDELRSALESARASGDAALLRAVEQRLGSSAPAGDGDGGASPGRDGAGRGS